MARKKKEFDSPRKVRTTLAELEVLTRLKDTVEWAVAKRLANRYIRNLMRISFRLLQNDPSFKVKHTELTGQALGIKIFIKMIDKSGKKLEEKEERKKNV